MPAPERYRITNVTEAPIELAYPDGPAPKAGEKDQRPMKALKVKPGQANAVTVDARTLDALKGRKVFKGAAQRGWLQVTSGDVVDIGA
jgi:hypothetical protein